MPELAHKHAAFLTMPSCCTRAQHAYWLACNIGHSSNNTDCLIECRGCWMCQHSCSSLRQTSWAASGAVQSCRSRRPPARRRCRALRRSRPSSPRQAHHIVLHAASALPSLLHIELVLLSTVWPHLVSKKLDICSGLSCLIQTWHQLMSIARAATPLLCVRFQPCATSLLTSDAC